MLVMETKRIPFAHVFSSLLLVTTSKGKPLPYEFAAVYEEMLIRQPRT